MGTVTDLNHYRALKAEEARQHNTVLSDALRRSSIRELLEKPYTTLTEAERQHIVRWLHVSAAFKEAERNALADALRGDA